jgi:hypothetical protein
MQVNLAGKRSNTTLVVALLLNGTGFSFRPLGKLSWVKGALVEDFSRRSLGRTGGRDMGELGRMC